MAEVDIHSLFMLYAKQVTRKDENICTSALARHRICIENQAVVSCLSIPPYARFNPIKVYNFGVAFSGKDKKAK